MYRSRIKLLMDIFFIGNILIMEKLPLIPPCSWDSKVKIWMPLPIKKKILGVLMPQDTNAKNQRKIHPKIYPNPYLRKQSKKLKWYGFPSKKKQLSQKRHPPLKNTNHPLPSISFNNITFLHPTSKEKIIKILSPCGSLNHSINHLLRKHHHRFLHNLPIKSFKVYHSVCSCWSWFQFILQHSHIPPSLHHSTTILHIFPIILSLWSMLLHKPFTHPLA